MIVKLVHEYGGEWEDKWDNVIKAFYGVDEAKVTSAAQAFIDKLSEHDKKVTRLHTVYQKEMDEWNEVHPQEGLLELPVKPQHPFGANTYKSPQKDAELRKKIEADHLEALKPWKEECEKIRFHNEAIFDKFAALEENFSEETLAVICNGDKELAKEVGGYSYYYNNDGYRITDVESEEVI